MRKTHPFSRHYFAALLACIVLLSSFSSAVLAASGETDLSAPTSSGEAITPTGIAIDTLEQEVDATMAPYIGKTCPGAAVVIIKDGQIVLSKGYGYADLENKTPVDPKTTVFEWGSVSKTFVWTAVMQLKEKGLLELNAPISQYIPADMYQKLGLRYDVTMLDLMNHRAGFEDVYHDLISAEPRGATEISEALLAYVPEQIVKPGTVSAYSNYSATLAAYIVECVSGQRYVPYLHENILSPLGMNGTGLEQDLSDAPELLANKAVGYSLKENESFAIGGSSYINMYPAGAMNGTAIDLARFATALTSDDTLLFENQATLDEMLSTSYQDTPELSGCAHGFWEYVGETTGYGHAGNTNFFSSYMMVFPEEEFSMLVLTNMQYESKILLALSELLIGEQKVVDLPESTDALPDVAAFAGGTYVGARNNFSAPLFGLLNTLSMLTVEKTGDQTIDLVSIFIPSDRYSFVQTSPGIFTATDSGDLAKKLAFVLENGKTVAISDGSDTDFVPLSSIEGWSREKALVILFILVLTSVFCLISLPAYILIAVISLSRKPDFAGKLSVSSRRLRFAARLAVVSALLSLLNVLTYLWRLMECGDMTKLTSNFHVCVAILLLILFLVAVVRQIYLFFLEKKDLKKSVMIKAFFSTIIVGSLYVVLALSNFFAII